MKTKMILGVAVVLGAQPGFGQSDTQTSTAFANAAIQIGGPEFNGDFYGSGNDDQFAEYGMATFLVQSSDFAVVPGTITDMRLTLTHNDRNFTDGTEIEFFYTPDDFFDIDANLSYDDTQVNGIDVTQYNTAPISLGTFAYTPEAGGETDTFVFNLTAGITSSMLQQFQLASEFQILITATDPGTDATFSGAGNTFDPGDPELQITVNAIPEPSAMVVVLGLFGGLALRRRCRG